MMPGRDVSSILADIKVGISAIEEECCDNGVLAAIEDDFLDLIELVKLFLISERSTYHGYMLMSMKVCVDFSSSTIAGVRINEYPPVLVSNPLLLCKLSLREIVYVVCHEVDHIVFNHPAEMLKSAQEHGEGALATFNYAADAAVNDALNFEIKNGSRYMTPPSGVVTSRWVAERYSIPHVLERESYLYYFNLIIENEPSSGDAFSPKGEMLAGNLSEACRSSGGRRSDVVTARTCGVPDDHDWANDMEPAEAESITREIINSTYEAMSPEARGFMPSRFLAQVRKMNEPPKIAWQALLKKYIGTISSDKRKTRTRLNRRQPARFDLPGSVDSRTLKIVVAIDTSASVSDEEISAIVAEIFAIVARRKHEVTIVECDSEIQRVYQAKGPDDVSLEVKGRGGTAFTPVVEYLNEDRYFRDALLIYFTDGFGEEEIPRPKTYRNLWVILGDESNLSLAEPYGSVVAI